MNSKLNRRSFLLQAGAAATVACSTRLFSEAAQSAAAELTLSELPSAPTIPLTYAGLSYELAQLTDPHFFSPDNRDLVEHFRLLSPHGVLRIGGNTSEFC